MDGMCHAPRLYFPLFFQHTGRTTLRLDSNPWIEEGHAVAKRPDTIHLNLPRHWLSDLLKSLIVTRVPRRKKSAGVPSRDMSSP